MDTFYVVYNDGGYYIIDDVDSMLKAEDSPDTLVFYGTWNECYSFITGE